jgi:hypothetical protein
MCQSNDMKYAHREYLRLLILQILVELKFITAFPKMIVEFLSDQD